MLTLVDALMSEHRDGMILRNLITNKKKLTASFKIALKNMGDKFVTGFAELVGGEKDPRNLMIVFSVTKVVLVEFDIVRHVEVCYFF